MIGKFLGNFDWSSTPSSEKKSQLQLQEENYENSSSESGDDTTASSSESDFFAGFSTSVSSFAADVKEFFTSYTAQECYDKGKACLAQNKPNEAMDYFVDAHKKEKDNIVNSTVRWDANNLLELQRQLLNLSEKDQDLSSDHRERGVEQLLAIRCKHPATLSKLFNDAYNPDTQRMRAGMLRATFSQWTVWAILYDDNAGAREALDSIQRGARDTRDANAMFELYKCYESCGKSLTPSQEWHMRYYLQEAVKYGHREAKQILTDNPHFVW